MSDDTFSGSNPFDIPAWPGKRGSGSLKSKRAAAFRASVQPLDFSSKQAEKNSRARSASHDASQKKAIEDFANGSKQSSDSISDSPESAPDAFNKSEPSDGIEIILKLVESGEIDPKNIDIIDVTDKFLKAIAAAPKENLRQSGKVLFHACVLLRMKAEALLAAANAELDHGDDFLDFDEDGGQLIYDSANQPVGRQITLQDLEKALVRKANTRQNRQRKVTLDQLISALREAEKIEKTREERQPRSRIDLSGHHQVDNVDDILDLAHDEDIEDTIERIDRMLEEYLETGETMNLVKVIKLLDRHGDWVDAFLAILFLSNAGKITLEQETFWGPLYIVRSEAENQEVRLAGNI